MKPFLTNKGSNLMNKFYVNIASESSNKDFVSKCEKHFQDHSSIKNIENNMEKCEFIFKHTSASTVEKIVKDLDSKKASSCNNIPAKLLKPVDDDDD